LPPEERDFAVDHVARREKPAVVCAVPGRGALHPDLAVSGPDARELRQAIEVAGLLGVTRVVTMSGLPAAEPAGTVPAWNFVPWDSTYLDSLAHRRCCVSWRLVHAQRVARGGELGLRRGRARARPRVVASFVLGHP
jgi:hypothetical protein